MTPVPPRLPPLLVVTDRTACARPLAEVVASAVDHGARAVVLRDRDLPEPERDRLADTLAALLEPVRGVLVRAGRRGPAVHLSAREEVPVPRPGLVGRSCHDRDEVLRAAEQGCDYVTVSPVFPTASKPGYGPALGTGGLARLARLAPPVYALGGVGPADVPACLAAGARGVAVLGPVMRDPRIVAAYVAALQEVES